MEILDEEYDQYSLTHHGVKDQKWGVTHGPPYPLDKNAARQARKAEKAKKRKERERNKRLAKARKTRKKNQIAKKKAAKEEVKEAKKRSKSLKNPGSMFKNRNRYEYTREEIQNALNKFDWEQKIQNYSTTRLENTSKKAQSIVKIMKSGVGGYNTVAAVYNEWFAEDKELPIINLPGGDGDGGGKKKKGGGGNNNSGGSNNGGKNNPPKKSEGDSSASLALMREVSEAFLNENKKEDEKKKKGK